MPMPDPAAAPVRSRPADALRPITVTRGFTKPAAGSVLWKQGETMVLCTATVESKRPRFFRDDRPGGWVTADYVMHPASTGGGRKPWPDNVHPDKRAMEIGRLIGRSLRAAVDLTKLGPHTIALDCTVLQADGGTRTASICGAMLALEDALATLPAEMPGAMTPGAGVEEPIPAAFDAAYYDPKGAIVAPLAAVSVGVVEGQVLLDLDYADDSRAEVDLNVVRTAAGNYVELQGAAEAGNGFSPDELAEMLRIAGKGIDELLRLMKGQG